MGPQCRGPLCTPRTEVSGGTEPAHTLILDFQSPDLGDMNEENKDKKNVTNTEPSSVWSTDAHLRCMEHALPKGLMTNVLLDNEG